jgi:hypothetical protein
VLWRPRDRSTTGRRHAKLVSELRHCCMRDTPARRRDLPGAFTNCPVQKSLISCLQLVEF